MIFRRILTFVCIWFVQLLCWSCDLAFASCRDVDGVPKADFESETPEWKGRTPRTLLNQCIQCVEEATTWSYGTKQCAWKRDAIPVQTSKMRDLKFHCEKVETENNDDSQFFTERQSCESCYMESKVKIMAKFSANLRAEGCRGLIFQVEIDADWYEDDYLYLLKISSESPDENTELHVYNKIQHSRYGRRSPYVLHMIEGGHFLFCNELVVNGVSEEEALEMYPQYEHVTLNYLRERSRLSFATKQESNTYIKKMFALGQSWEADDQKNMEALIFTSADVGCTRFYPTNDVEYHGAARSYMVFEKCSGAWDDFVSLYTNDEPKSPLMPGIGGFRDLLHLIRDLAEALEFLHYEMEIVHMDLKPQNILYVNPETNKPRASIDGESLKETWKDPSMRISARLFDFDASLQIGEELSISEAKFSMGYMSPELNRIRRRATAENHIKVKVASRHDMPAVAIIIYELLRGTLFRNMFTQELENNQRYDDDILAQIDSEETFFPWSYEGIEGEDDAVESDIFASIIEERAFDDFAEYVETLWQLMKACYYKQKGEHVLTSRELRQKLEEVIDDFEQEASEKWDVESDEQLDAPHDRARFKMTQRPAKLGAIEERAPKKENIKSMLRAKLPSLSPSDAV